MRSIALCTLFLVSIVTGRLFADDAYLRSAGDASTIAKASPASLPRENVPLQTLIPEAQNLELRQVPKAAADDDVPTVDPTTTQSVSPNAATYVHTSIDPALPAPGVAFPAAASASGSVTASPAPANPAVAATSSTGSSSLLAANNLPPAAAPVAPAAKPAIADATSTTTTPAPVPGLTGDDYTSVHWVETWIGGTYSTWVPKTRTIHFETRTPGPPPGSGRIGLGTIKGEAGKTKTIYVGAAATPAAGWARGVAAAVGVGVAGMIV